MIKEISKENIRKKVMSEISKAKKEILATLEVTEEMNHPLPARYFLLLERKNEGGIKIKRIIFGSTKEYKFFLENIKLEKLFFTGKHTQSKNYKRMIMIDGIKLFFRKRVKGKEKFYFTDQKKVIRDYKTYFNRFK